MASGGDIVQLAKRHVGEQYQLGAHVDYTNADFKGPWDCAEFASWCLYQAARLEFGVRQEPAGLDAYSGYWAEDARTRGAIVRWQEAATVAGAFLVRSPGAHAQTPSGHVVICSGDGSTIEAMDSRRGVVQGRIENRLWDLGVLVPGVDYSRASLTRFPEVPLYSLRAGNPLARGPLVRRIASRLQSLGHYGGEPTDTYGPELAGAVAKYQAQRGLVPDGEVGKRTYAALFQPRRSGSKATRGSRATRGRSR